MKHAELPSLCPRCLAALHRTAEATQDGITATWCPHRATLARATVADARVLHVVLDGPVTPEAAHAQLAALDARLRPDAAETVLHVHPKAH